jgi:hypothetical protein
MYNPACPKISGTVFICTPALELDRFDPLQEFLVGPVWVVEGMALRYEVIVPQVDDAVCRVVGVDHDFDLNHAW